MRMNDIATRIEDGMAFLTLNRPEARNAISPRTSDEILSFLEEIEKNDTIGAVVINAAGAHFSAGGDVKDFLENAQAAAKERGAVFQSLIERANPIFLTIERMPQIVIASARGYTAGSGLCFIGAADLAIVSENTRFMLSHIKIGGVPDAGATYYLPRQIGIKRAKELICTGDAFDAPEALRMGLVNRVVPDDRLEEETLALAMRFSSAPRLAVAEAKRLVNRSLQNDLAGQLGLEAAAVGRIAQTDDFIEGITAFLEKRKPAFQGK